MKPFYPARPRQGGSDFERALTRRYTPDQWQVEPKLNGWRALLHLPTGQLFNRHGADLSIGNAFAEAIVLIRLAVNDSPVPVGEWMDCEALDRRHGIGRGALVVLDLPDLAAKQEDRTALLAQILPPVPTPAFFTGLAYAIQPLDDPLLWWMQMPRLNTDAGCTFYEGVVAKRTGAPYHRQTRSPSEECPYWTKHRFTTLP